MSDLKSILEPAFCFVTSDLPEGTLGRDFYDLQSNLNIDGLVHEIKDHLNELGIMDLKAISEPLWKRKIKSYIKDLTRKELNEDMKKYKR